MKRNLKDMPLLGLAAALLIAAGLFFFACSSEKTGRDPVGTSAADIDYYTCTMHPSVKQMVAGTCPICAMNLTPVYKTEQPIAQMHIDPTEHEHSSDIDYYTCTMHPSVHEKQPGKCPICAMNLVPVYKEGDEPQPDAGDKQVRTVKVSLYQQQLIGVQRDTVKIRVVQKTIRTTGRVVYDETKIATVNLKFSGWLEELYVDYVGQFVKQGQPLFAVYSPELVSTQDELLQMLSEKTSITAAGSKNSGRSLDEIARERLRLWGLTDEQIKQIVQSKKPQLRVTYFSPFTGHVIAKNILRGQHAQAGMDLYKIADLSSVWVFADVYESELPYIRLHQQVRLTLPYDSKVELLGQVDYIYPSLNGQTRTAKIRMGFSNSWLTLRPEMYADVEVAVDLGEQLVVPQTAVLNTGRRKLVFVDRGGGRFEPREIKTGWKVETFYTVQAGLQEGEVVVKSGNFLIDAEAHVQGVLQTM
ncbi:MAG: efflux RND transporter periplasmic adaptor subunit [bacterium]